MTDPVNTSGLNPAVTAVLEAMPDLSANEIVVVVASAFEQMHARADDYPDSQAQTIGKRMVNASHGHLNKFLNLCISLGVVTIEPGAIVKDNPPS